MTTSADLLGLVKAAITSATDAEDRVWSPGDWPAQPDQFPHWKLRLIAENRVSLGKGGPAQFSTTATIRMFGAVSEPAELDNAGASQAEASLMALKRQGEVAVINSYPLTLEIEQISAIRSTLAFTSESATHLAGITIDVDLQFYEGPEDFAQPATVDLTEVRTSISGFSPVGFTDTLPA